MLKRRKPLQRSGSLKRRGPLRRRNPERLARRRAEQFGPQAELCRTLACVVCWRPHDSPVRSIAWFDRRRPNRSDPHHIVSRGAGGTDRDCVPLCRHHHDEIHRIGRDTFQERHGVDLRAVADALSEELS